MIHDDKIEGFGWARGIETVYGRPSTTYRRGRICSRSGCGTHLSRYNPTTRCSIHDELI
jgi:hypothetical protein